MSKKALVLTEVFHPEDFIINDLVDGWLDDGYDLEILTRNPSYPYGKVLNGFKNKLYHTALYKGAKVHRFFVIPGYQSSLAIKLLNYINYMFFSFWILLFIGKRFDKVFIYQTGPLTNAFSAVLLKPIFKYKITIWSQDLWPDTIYAYGLKQTKFTALILNALVRFMYSGCDTILISCHGFKDKITALLKSSKPIYWVPNWSMVDGFSEKKAELPQGFNFSFAGNIGKVQNLDFVVRGFKNVVAHYPEAYLNIIGDGSYLETLKNICITEQIPHVNFTGRQPLQDMPAYFAASDVLLISLVDVPLYEIMIPSKFQTYLTAKKPIYSIMKGEVSTMVVDAHIGVSAMPSDLLAIEKGFIHFLSASPEILNAMSNSSETLLDTHFNAVKTKAYLNNIFWND